MKTLSKTIKFILLFLIVCNNLYSISDSTNTNIKPRLLAGISLIPSLNFNSGIYKAVNKNNICCNDLEFSNTDFAFGFEINSKALFHNLYGLPIFDSLSYSVSSQFNFSGNAVKGSNFEPRRQVILNNELSDLIERNEIQINYSSLFWIINFELGTPFDSLNYYTNLDKPTFYFSLGPVIGFIMNNDYTQTLSIVKPSGYLYSNGKSTKVSQYDSFDGFNSFVFGINLNFDAYWNAYQIVRKDWSKEIELGFGIRYIHLFTSLIDNQDINNSSLGLKLNILYNLPLYKESKVE